MSDTKQIDDGGPAFPHSHDWGWSEKTRRYEAAGQSGMTLRDWFAGQALAVAWKDLARSEDKPEFMTLGNRKLEPYKDVYTGSENLAELAYEIADAMLVARNKKE